MLWRSFHFFGLHMNVHGWQHTVESNIYLLSRISCGITTACIAVAVHNRYRCPVQCKARLVPAGSWLSLCAHQEALERRMIHTYCIFKDWQRSDETSASQIQSTPWSSARAEYGSEKPLQHREGDSKLQMGGCNLQQRHKALCEYRFRC